MTEDTRYGAPGRPSTEATVAARQALDAVGLTQGSILAGGINDQGEAWLKLNPKFSARFAFLLELLQLEAKKEDATGNAEQQSSDEDDEPSL